MSKNTTVSLTLQIKGQQASQEMKRISDQQVTTTTKINQQWTQIGNAQAKFVNTAKAGTRETINTARAGDQLLRTNKMLEQVLRQQSIQTKLQGQLYKQNVASAQQLANWTKQIEQSSKRTQQHVQQTAGSMGLLQKGGALATGAAATSAVISTSLQKPRNYDQQLTYIAATATGGQGMSTAARLAARGQLNEYIKGAVRSGGGTREDAAEAANTLIASGKYDLGNVNAALNASVKTAFATGASAKDAATLTTRLMDFGVSDLQKGHDIAVRGGQLGSFEYKDQAKWLAQQMAAAKTIGYSGEKGLVELVAMNQVAMSTAANPDEAGNNVVNLLTKLSSREFSKSIGDEVKVQKGDPTKLEGKKKPHEVFDWNTYLIRQREQGVLGVEAFVKLLERQFASSSQYQGLKNKAMNPTNSSELEQTLQDMTNIAEGGEIGKIIADRQALMSALSVVYKKDELTKLRNELPNAGGTTQADSSMVRQTEWAKDLAANQEALFAQTTAYNSLSEVLGKVKDEAVDWARKHEDLAGAAYGATVALGALAAGATITSVLRGGKNPDLISTGDGKPPPAVGRDPITNLPKNAKLPTTTVKPNVGAGGAFGLVGAAYAGSQFIKPYDDAGYNFISQVLSKIGIGDGGESPDFVQQAIDKNKEQQALLQQQVAEQQQQNQLSRDMIGKLNTLINVTGQNKPTFSFGGSLLDGISQNAQQQEKRHGAPPPYMIVK
ncbi:MULTISPECIES: phage tail tape measure protein [unclassified Acinetobacter]|uniref:phage tail tape measure protein n=1 Tax=unclassified Acinetobacter TaxID=196816 RepID=UPI001909942F|nr:MULTISPECIES: phage tail tape measure protein [unclassified Acinetobacter]MBK0063972.1 phage tail tape measure protein [Acinetobacter sp. S55]MBK0067257.1 phage tail tape measure protein [Acinetobacter sp. S54]